MNFPNWFFYLFLAMYLIHFCFEATLELLNMRETRKNANAVPPLYQGHINADEHRKSIDYTLAKTKFGLIQTVVAGFFTWFLILSGAFQTVDTWLSGLFSNYPFVAAVAYPFFIGAIFMVFQLPFSAYFQFVLEQRFGFNKTTVHTFFGDQFKGVLLSLILGIPIVSVLFWLVEALGNYWWLFGFALILAFQIFMAAAYPVLIAPIFNKFVPLANEQLKERIIALADKANMKMAGVFSIDGSKRSTHANAFFAGFGRMRRIVLFDTLQTMLNEDEIISVVAHEMGHNVKKHIQKTVIFSSFSMLFFFYILSLALDWQPFFEAFKVATPSTHVGFVLFVLFSGVFLFPLAPLSKLLSRKHEYEADQFSIESTGDKQNLVSALIKLSRENASNLTPHPWYSFYHYSHPTTGERALAISKIP